MKKIFIGIAITIASTIIIILIAFYIIVKNNPDFAPYIAETYNTEYTIHSDIYKISEIKKEMTKIAQEYEEGIKLTQIEYNFENIKEGKTTFSFYRENYGENKACRVDIIVNMTSRKVTEINYYKGHGKRISGYLEEINNNMDVNVLDYIPEKNLKVTIKITNYGIETY